MGQMAMNRIVLAGPIRRLDDHARPLERLQDAGAHGVDRNAERPTRSPANRVLGPRLHDRSGAALEHGAAERGQRQGGAALEQQPGQQRSGADGERPHRVRNPHVYRQRQDECQ